MIALLKDYSASRKTLDAARAKDLAERLFKIDGQRVNLNKKDFKKFSQALPPPRVLQFFQLSRRIDLLVNLRIAATLPMMGEDW
jgi:hypothetical protein